MFSGKLVALKKLKSLTFENLYAGIARAISQIECLQLESFHIEDLIFSSDIEPISKSVSKISTLKKLEIQTNDTGCRSLSDLSNLEEIIIRDSDLSQIGIIELAKLKSLKKIKFCYCYNVNQEINILKAGNPQLKVEIEGDERSDNDSDGHDCDYDFDPDDYSDCDTMPREFYDNYNELNLNYSGYDS